MRDLVLHLTSLAKTVPGGRRLFYGLTLALEAGERVAIRGESGAGKSTLLNIIAGLDTADSGEIMVAGTDLTRLGETERTARRGCGRTRPGRNSSQLGPADCRG